MMSLLCITIISLTLAGSAYCEMTSPSSVEKVTAHLGENITLPCTFPFEDNSFFGSMGIRVKWTKLGEDESLTEDVLTSMGFHKNTYGSFKDRVFMQEYDSDDASIVITDVTMDDVGKYRCDATNGEEDYVVDIIVELEHDLTTEGVVFPYFPHMGRYNMIYDDAVQACESQDAVVANFDQLVAAWKSGLDWCNAGWLNDGTVHYPITKPREPCGGSNSKPGLRSYGRRDKKLFRFDVFCYVSELNGHFYWLVQPERLSFDEAVQACYDDGAEIAKVGHMYAAWKLEGYDRCDAGWLADGSVRYPISRPRKNCSPTEAAVRFVGFPNKTMNAYGVYCFRPE